MEVVHGPEKTQRERNPSDINCLHILKQVNIVWEAF